MLCNKKRRNIKKKILLFIYNQFIKYFSLEEKEKKNELWNKGYIIIYNMYLEKKQNERVQVWIVIKKYIIYYIIELSCECSQRTSHGIDLQKHNRKYISSRYITGYI